MNRVLAYSNQQISATFGGPITRDKIHFFGYYEGEREPKSITFTSPFPRFNIPDLTFNNTHNMAGSRFDAQLSDKTRLMVRANGWINRIPISGTPGATSHPSTLQWRRSVSGQLFVSLTQTLGAGALNEIKGGVSLFHDDRVHLVPGAVPQIRLRNYTIGPTYDLREYQDNYSIRDDFSIFRRGHEMKVGGELLVPANFIYWANYRDGIIDATLGAPPTNLEELFPVWDDISTWNLAPLSPIARRYLKSFGTYEWRRAKPQTAAWFQDNWSLTTRLTLNLGLRWDFALDGLANEITLLPVRTPLPQEWWNIGPRLGFAYSLADNKTVIRGGWGLYFSGISDTHTHTTLIDVYSAAPEVFNDGRPNFAADPYNTLGGGREPTFDEARLARRDYVLVMYGKTPYSYQTAAGLQRQIGQTMAVQADYIWVAGRREETSRNVNLSFDPATGANYPFNDVNKRPYPGFGRIPMRLTEVDSNYHALETAFTKRFSNRWQASATYTLAGYWNAYPLPINPGCRYPMNGLTMTCDTLFPVPIVLDLGGEYGLGALGALSGEGADQRHRAVFNGIWELAYGLQLSGLYFFASGERYATSYGGDLRDTGASSSRLRPNGTIVPRNAFVGQPLHRVDLRVQRRFPLPGGVRVEGMVEMFNVFNHANYGSYVTNEASAAYGRPVQNLNVAYQPRMMQLGFRVTF